MTDPFLWLEEVTGDKALDWVREQNAQSTETFATGAEFTQLQNSALTIYQTAARIPYVQRRGDFLYNFWRDESAIRGQWRRTTLESYRTDNPLWDILIDVDNLASGDAENWVWKSVQLLRPHYQRALVSLSRGGADAVVLREFDIPSRRFIPESEGGFFLPENKLSASWIDSETLYVGTDFGDIAGVSSLTNSGYPRVIKKWSRGTPLSAAPIVAAGEPSDVAVSAHYDDTPGFERHFFTRATDFYNSEVFEIFADGTCKQLPIPTDAESEVFGELLFITTKSPWTVDNLTIPAGALVVTDYPASLTGKITPTILFQPTPHTSLQGFTFTRSQLVLVLLTDVLTSLLALELHTWDIVEISGLPTVSTLNIISTDHRNSDEIFIAASSFTAPATLFHGTTSGGVHPIKHAPALYNSKDVVVQQFFAHSNDGTHIPYFVVKRRDITSGPTLLYGYGGFEVSLTPDYDAVAGKNWVERGGIYVIANIRGGGEYGPHWHTQTQIAGRHLVYEDFAAVAQDLVERQLATTKTLAAQGGSNGGLLMGVMATKYPELFGALVCQVPLLDMQRYHLLLAGASWVAEYGNPDDSAEWEILKTHSPYQNLSAQPMPTMLVTTSTRDDRVHPGHARKFVARAQELGHKIHYYENIEGGHGGAADNHQLAYKTALIYHFLWQTIGAGNEN